MRHENEADPGEVRVTLISKPFAMLTLAASAQAASLAWLGAV